MENKKILKETKPLKDRKKEDEMDGDLKDVLKYVLGAIVGYIAFWTLLTRIIKDFNIIIIYTLILTTFLWLIYLHMKIFKIKGGEKDDQK